MKINWLGHSTFIIKSNKTLVTDPFDPTVGKLPADLMADIVTVSHSHFDHNYIQGIAGNPQIINQIGDYNTGDFKIKGIASFHDNESGAKRGANIIYLIDAEGLKICHLGDLGHILTDEQISNIGPVDVLMIPVGGVYTIDANEATEAVNQLNPKVVLPMHYQSQKSLISSPLLGVEKFNEILKWPVEEVNELEIDQNTISSINHHVVIFK